MVTSAGDLTEILNMLAIINQAALYVAIYLSFFFFFGQQHYFYELRLNIFEEKSSPADQSVVS